MHFPRSTVLILVASAISASGAEVPYLRVSASDRLLLITYPSSIIILCFCMFESLVFAANLIMTTLVIVIALFLSRLLKKANSLYRRYQRIQHRIWRMSLQLMIRLRVDLLRKVKFMTKCMKSSQMILTLYQLAVKHGGLKRPVLIRIHGHWSTLKKNATVA